MSASVVSRRVPVAWVMAVLSALLASGYGVLFTMLDEFRDEYGIGETALGALIGLGFLSAFVAQILIAPQADRGHARRLVFIGVAMNVVGLLLMAASGSFAPLMLGRLISGLGIGVAVPATRRIVILADPQDMGENLGRLLAADVAGFAAGPVVSAVLVGTFGIAAPFLAVATATTLVLVLVVGVQVDEAEEPPARLLALDLLRIRPFAGAVMMGAAVFLMIGAFDALWSIVLDDLDTSEWIANLGISLFALPLVILAPGGGRLAQRIGPFRVATVGLLLAAGYMTLYGLVPSGGIMFADRDGARRHRRDHTRQYGRGRRPGRSARASGRCPRGHRGISDADRRYRGPRCWCPVSAPRPSSGLRIQRVRHGRPGGRRSLVGPTVLAGQWRDPVRRRSQIDRRHTDLSECSDEEDPVWARPT